MEPHVSPLPYQGPERREGPRLSQEDWRRQEHLSSVTHLVAAVLSLWTLGFLVLSASRWGNVRHVVAFSVFGSCMVFIYGASALMHHFPIGRTRRVFEKLDLSGVFLLIAGTYTPFTLVTLGGRLGWGLLIAAWLLALGGIFWIHWHRESFEKRAAPIYLIMGWLIVLALKPLSEALPLPGLALLVGGGLAYTAGVFFFFWTGTLHHHSIWHVFVMLGSALHTLCVLLYVLPDLRAGFWP